MRIMIKGEVSCQRVYVVKSRDKPVVALRVDVERFFETLFRQFVSPGFHELDIEV